MPEKAVIGILASHDDYEVNRSLVLLLNRVHSDASASPTWRGLIEQYQLVFTGGTYRRIIDGEDWPARTDGTTGPPPEWNRATAAWLRDQPMHAVRLPPSRQGGVTMLANLIAYRQCCLLWGFLSAATTHWINPENLALMRLCDHCRVKRLMNTGSVIEWLRTQAAQDQYRNRQPLPLRMRLAGCIGASMQGSIPSELFQVGWEERLRTLTQNPAEWNDQAWRDRNWQSMTVALIAHDDMKQRMVDFAVDFEPELSQFGRILTTGTTGKEVTDAVPSLLGRVLRCHSGPKGGDIQIATETVLGFCDIVIFFVDTLHSHPHIEDIRVVFGACMARPSVRMITNEMQARDWMSTVVRRALASGSVRPQD